MNASTVAVLIRDALSGLLLAGALLISSEILRTILVPALLFIRALVGRNRTRFARGGLISATISGMESAPLMPFRSLIRRYQELLALEIQRRAYRDAVVAEDPAVREAGRIYLEADRQLETERAANRHQSA